MYCLRFYRGDENIKHFIWDLITPAAYNDPLKIKNHHGLKDPVPRGVKCKNKRLRQLREGGRQVQNPNDPNHWSKQDKYNGDIFLESNYRKHLSRHANK